MNEGVPPPKKRNWLLIILGVIALGFVVTIGGCGIVAYLVWQSVSISDVSANAADSELEKVRAKFAGQPALIQMVDGRAQYVGERARPASATEPLKTMHIVAWDDDEGKLVRVAVPFWLLRLQSGNFRLNSYADGWDGGGVNFRLQDVEKHGPGLLLDIAEDAEGRVIIWVE